ncbi:MAG: hypothetical protein EHM24_32775, partial [Acidobacteria bacterium]
MSPSSLLPRTCGAVPRFVTLVAASFALFACDASTTTVLGPTPPKCSVTASAEPRSFGVAGGSGTLSITTERECSWTVTAEAAWLSLPSNRQGQGPATLAYTVSQNQAPAARSAAIAVNDARVEISQQAAACTFEVAPSSLEIGADGGDAEIRVETLQGCAWEARSLAGWIGVLSNGTGNGSATVRLRVAPNDGSDRSGEVEVAGRRITARQAGRPATPSPDPGPGCTFSVSPPSLAFPPEGSVIQVNVSAGPGCSWTARSSAGWLHVTAGANGSGNGTFRVQAEPNTSTTARSATVSVGGSEVEVTQQGATACTYDPQPRTFTLSNTGGVARVQVNTQASCTWTSQSQSSWLTVSAGASGTGPGAVEIQAAANTTTSARSGAVTVAGVTITVNQAAAPAPCTYAVEPASLSFPDTGGQSSVAVTTAAGCAWTATSGAEWLTVTSGASGTGNGTVRVSAASNPATTQRSTTLIVAGVTVAVTQAPAPPP